MFESTLKTIITSCLLVFSFASQSQNETQKDYLVVYGQVWGFLKYFHPEPSKQNWDQVLINDFNSIKECKNDSEFDSILSNTIAICSDYKSKKRNIPDSLIIQSSFEWMNHKLISGENQSYLSELLQNKPKFKNKYILKAFAGNPKITNETEFGEFSNDQAVHYLALTRYWNVINYYFPYHDIIPKNWTIAYKDHLSDFLSISTYKDYYFAVRGITAEIRDAHGFIRTDNNPIASYKFPPFVCMSLSDGVFITYVKNDSLNPSKIQRMDKLISINGKSMEDKFIEIGKFTSSSNDYYLSKSTYYLRATEFDTMVVTVERNGEIITDTLITVDRSAFRSKNNAGNNMTKRSPYGFIKDSISGKVYCQIHMGRLKRSDITRKFKRSLFNVDYLIIDSRNYPNWTLPKLTRVLINGRRKFAKFSQINYDSPGSFIWTKSQTIGSRSKGYEGKIYVLVDYHTMSQAEYTVMALQQHPNTVVIGGQTAGADGNLSEIPLPYGVTSCFSGLGVYYLDGSPTQQVGIQRDIHVVQNKSYVEERIDLISTKALELIRKD